MTLFRVALLSIAALLCTAPAAAVDEADLLPVEQAFALTATATAPDRIELRWAIADGYYLYRHRIGVAPVDPALRLPPLQLPDGEHKTDEFFGEVETYRGSMVAVLSGALPAGAKTLQLEVKSQGCADIGVCYPPHKQIVQVTLPSPTAGTNAPVGAEPATPAPAAPGSGFAALTRALGGDGAAVSVGADGATDALPLPPEQAFALEAIAGSPTELLLRFTPAAGYYLYRDRSTFEITGGDGVRLHAPRWPQGVTHEDEYFGASVVYFDQVEVPLPLTRTGGAAQTIAVKATFQGCQDGGICYPPMTRTLSVALPAATAAQLATAADAPGTDVDATRDAPAELAEDSRLAAALSGPNLGLTLLSFFGFGLLLAFTPCVFPMVPILSGIIAGAGTLSTTRAFVLSLVYVLATAIVFTIAGVIAGLAGANLQAAFQTPWILVAFALVFVALALSMFGFYELQLPSSVQTRLAQLSNRQSGGSLLGVAIMGVLSALIVGPCVAPPLAAAVLYISQTRDPVLGGLALFTLAMGMGAPLLAVGTAAGKWLPRAGGWMDAVKAVFGVLFLGVAIWMLERILTPVWILLLVGALLIGCAVYLGALVRLPDGASGWRKLWQALGLVLLIAGAAQLVGALAGGRDVLQPLRGVFGGGPTVAAELPFRTIKSSEDLDRAIATANAAGQPVLFDFYADWCVSCKEMEKYTFTDTGVRAALAPFVLLKADVTANDAVDQALMRRFGIVGPPATLWFGLDGAERRALRLVGYEKADKFVERVARARAP